MNKKIGKNTKNLKVVFAFCLGVVLSATGVYAATQIAADTVSFTSKSGLTSTNIQDAIDEVYTAKNTCPEDKICYKKICKRATKLHTEECNTERCQYAGYTKDGKHKTTTITYGNLGTSGTLTPGDAFDCDVNGDGVYDPDTERFYYVSNHYNTRNKSFNDKFATLIFFSNTVDGEINIPGSTSLNYDTIGLSMGPRNAIRWLPTTRQWNNISITGGSDKRRQILTETSVSKTKNNIDLPLFDYGDRAARLLTYQEIVNACPDAKKIYIGNSGTDASKKFVGEVADKCNYLLEKTQFSNIANWHTNYWLETVEFDNNDDEYAYYFGISSGTSFNDYTLLSTFYSNKGTGDGGYQDSPGVRPVIEMNKLNIEY